MSELSDVLQSGYYESLLGNDNVGWFVNEVLKLEIKMAFHFKNINEILLGLKKTKNIIQNVIICRFFGRKIY